jgi:hypothetical protein
MFDNFSKFGRSGCKFYLDENGIILRKISSHSEYNDRLHSQYLKQSKFESNNNFATPIPYKFNKSEELHFFDMEYIHGKTFNNFCLNSSVDDILAFSENLNLFLIQNFKSSLSTEINFNKLENKLLKLSNQLGDGVLKYINFLLSNPIESLPIGKNHGDLTMSNIIFSDKHYLIDFLDNPYETPLNDLIKIKQDTEHNFYFNLLGNVETKVKICLDYIDNELNKKFDYLIGSHEFIWLSIFNLLRVLPYLKSKKEVESILKSLSKYECYITSSGKIK